MSALDILRCFSTDGHDDLPATVERLPTVGEVKEAVAEVERLRAYADELAAGWPEGMLPADIRNIKAANWTFAQQVHDLTAEIEWLRTELQARNTRLVIMADALLDIRNFCAPDTFAHLRADDALKGGEK